MKKESVETVVKMEGLRKHLTATQKQIEAGSVLALVDVEILLSHPRVHGIRASLVVDCEDVLIDLVADLPWES